MTNTSVLAQVLINPEQAKQLSLQEWDLLIQQGYCSSLLARIMNRLEPHNIEIPAQALIHLKSAQTKAKAHAEDVIIEIDAIIKALKPAGITPVFLKGAAYIIAKDQAASGRFFSDVDVFVPQTCLATAEQFFKWQGWKQESLDVYDEQYYRRWMHEIPALIHQKRGTALDVHHNLLPLIGRIKIDSALLQQTISTGQLTLSSQDRLLHSAVHLFCSGELIHGFRDLSDLDLMVRQFSNEDSGFWNKLLDRSDQLGVGRLLYYSLRYSERHLRTPIPLTVKDRINDNAPNPIILMFIDTLFDRALPPHHSSCRRSFRNTALMLLLIRSHWLKMPLTTLIPHLLRKAVVNPIKNRGQSTEQTTGQN